MIFLELAMFVYAAATLSYFVAVFWKSAAARTASWWILLGGGALHVGFMVWRGVEAGRWPFIGVFESVTSFSAIFVIVYLAFEKKTKVSSLGVFVSPMVLLFLFYAFMNMGETAGLEPVLKSAWFPIHVTAFFVSYSLFTLSFAGACAYLVQEWLLKKKRDMGMLKYFPPLEALGTVCHRSVTLAFPMLTVGIITGAVWAQSAWGVFWKWEPKLTFALVTWLWYAVYLHLRFVGGWQGRKTKIALIVGFMLLLATFLAVNYLPGEMHNFAKPGE